MSDGLITTRPTVPSDLDGAVRTTGRRPPARSNFCNTMLWIDHQKGIATWRPAS